ncbi:MAG TPA: patatin-like phospholipase family protein, partial [Rhodothermales bacterium]|nr:patatin-like phospholipase family protein [Rhodothermales bacterium]
MLHSGFLLLLIFACCSSVNAQENAGCVEAPPPGTRPLVLTVSGGISLGSYLAGVNWATLYLLKLAEEDSSWTDRPRPDSLGPFQLVVATGASAGNINALFSAAEWSREDFARQPPERTLFWRMWTEVGLGHLLPEFETPSGVNEDSFRVSELDDGILTRQYFTGRLRNILFARLRAEGPRTFDPCSDVAVGISLTRVDPVTVDLPRPRDEAIGFRIHTQRAVSVYRVNARDSLASRLYIGHHDATRTPQSRAPAAARGARAFTPFGVSSSDVKACFEPSRLGQLALPAFDSDTTNATENESLALQLTLASSAFPMAFAPVPLRHTTGRTYQGWATGYQTRPFVDGGIFDNNPLGLAYELYDYAGSPNTVACIGSPEANPPPP